MSFINWWIQRTLVRSPDSTYKPVIFKIIFTRTWTFVFPLEVRNLSVVHGLDIHHPHWKKLVMVVSRHSLGSKQFIEHSNYNVKK